MPKVEGKKSTPSKVVLNHFSSSRDKFFSLDTLDPWCLRQNLVSTATPLCTFLRSRNRAKTQDTNFVQKSFNPNARSLILFIFSFFLFHFLFFLFFWFFSLFFSWIFDLIFFDFFYFSFFDFFLIFSFWFFWFFLTPHEGVLIFTTRGCLLDWSYNPNDRSKRSLSF